MNDEFTEMVLCLTAAYFMVRSVLSKSRDSSVGIVTGNELDGQGSIPGRGKRFLSSP
jgi:hypothetical protein